VDTGTDYELPTTMDEHQQEELNEKIEENIERQEKEQEIIQSLSTSPAQINENVQDEDVLVEENVTPFYMNSGRLIK
jgi:uncharacterized protein with von Willebrand factor type A (vWA) domain